MPQTTTKVEESPQNRAFAQAARLSSLLSASLMMNVLVCRHVRKRTSAHLGHMIPHATHGFADSGMPENLPYFLTLSGYMLIFFVEKVAFDTHTIMHDGVGDGHDHGSVATTAGAKGSEVAAGTPSGRSAIILLLALGVHALMETMALGLSSSRVSAGLLAMSIGLHQVHTGCWC